MIKYLKILKKEPFVSVTSLQRFKTVTIIPEKLNMG